jgi:integrase
MPVVNRIQCGKTKIPGVYKLPGGGHLVRALVTDPKTGKRKEVSQVMRDEPSAIRAGAWLESEKARIRNGVGRGEDEARTIPKLKDFAESLFREKSNNGDLNSAASRQKWFAILKSHVFTAPFASFYVDRIRRADVLAWKATIKIGKNRKKGDVSPVYANDWLGVLAIISKAAVVKFDLEYDFMMNVPKFATRHWRTRLKEKPINLTPTELAVFLSIYRERHPDTYAMVALGYMIGARPSSLRPIRRKGPNPDYNAKTGALILRQSHTLGEEVMDSTKNAEDVTVILPPAMRDIIAWHIAKYCTYTFDPSTEKRPGRRRTRMAESDLLFPSPTSGGFHVAGRLLKPFRDVSKAMREKDPEFKKVITPKSMRRSNKDLLRQEGVSALVAQAINSHDDAMHKHYSTVSEDEKAVALAKVVRLFPVPAAKSG